jgi:predicted PurR-regulated permease PerM
VSWWRFALWAIVVAIALFFLWSVRGVLLPFAISWVIAVLLEPVVKAMTSRGAPRGASILVITLVFFFAFFAVGLWVGPRIASQFGELQKSIRDLTSSIAEETRSENHFVRWNPTVLAQPPGPLGAVDRTLENLAPTLERMGLPSTRRAIFDQYVAPQRDQIAEGIASFFNGFFRILLGAASQLFIFFFIPILVGLFLGDMDSFRPRLLAAVPPALRPGVSSTLEDVGNVFKSYLRGVLLNVTIYTSVFAILFSAFGLPYPILLGLLAGALYLIPMLGGPIAAVSVGLIVGFSGTTGNWLVSLPNSWIFALGVAVVFWVLASVYDALVTPRLVGSSVGLDPVLSMFVVFSGAALFGLPGMIIAYPLAGAVKVTLAKVLGVTHQSAPEGSVALPSVPMRHRTESAASSES